MKWHIVTSEYPPRAGGVADYTRIVAEGLAAAGDDVHVWCPPVEHPPASDGVHVHPALGRMGQADLRRVGRQLAAFTAPRHLLVQWVPHGYGYRAMNVGFCCWVWWRARVRGDRVDIMVHEPYLAFGEHAWRHAGVALVHRFMTIVLAAATRRIWVAIPTWEFRWRRYALGRRPTFTWLPVPSPLTGCRSPGAATRSVRERYAHGDGPLVGHFGTYGPAVSARLAELLPRLLAGTRHPSILLLGAGSDRLCREVADRHPDLAGRLSATGYIPGPELPAHLAACDLFVQPYPDGVSSRRSSTMAILSLGRPLVTTRGPLTEDVWPASEAVALAEVADSDGLVGQVDRLLSDPEERERLGEAGRALYARCFDVSRTVAALREAARSDPGAEP